MAYRGRGRFGYGQNAGIAKEVKYEIFPEIKEYPEINLKQTEEFKKLIAWGDHLQKFWVASPYHLGASGQSSDSKRKIPLSEYMEMTDGYVPAELVATNVRRRNKKVRWDPQSDLQRLDLFEKLDQGPLGQDDGEKNEDEDDDEDNEIIEDEEEGSGDDYDQNQDFDDDEDDFNIIDDIGDDEGCY